MMTRVLIDRIAISPRNLMISRTTLMSSMNRKFRKMRMILMAMLMNGQSMQHSRFLMKRL